MTSKSDGLRRFLSNATDQTALHSRLRMAYPGETGFAFHRVNNSLGYAFGFDTTSRCHKQEFLCNLPKIVSAGCVGFSKQKKDMDLSFWTILSPLIIFICSFIKQRGQKTNVSSNAACDSISSGPEPRSQAGKTNRRNGLQPL